MVKLSKVAKERGIRFFLISFADLAGAPKAKLVPAEAIDQMQETGAGFAGFAVSLDMTPADPDMWAKPDPDSLIQLPWKPEVGWLCADAWMDGAPLDNTPRVLLGKMIEKARKKGLRMKTGVEAEFIITNAAGSAASDPLDVARRPAYDQMALMRRYDVISEICSHMIALGWKPYQNDHEDANGQFEINWEYDDCLRTADKHVFFKYMVKTLAEKHGYRATFMPKPFMSQTGSGCHAHVSFWD
ncbi:MAG: type III glutamate--ammonia ligase, partial [Alphaproteobacteria bacterium]|nr:type III glutamate--ammonia ligase [Alphaproteobacteria bacterium]